MRLKILTFVLLLALGALSVKAYYSGSLTGASVQLAVVNIDPTPLDRDSPGLVTSYADVLDQVRPAVVSVFSTRVVRQRQWNPFGDDPRFRRFFGVPEEQTPREQRRQGLGSGVIVTDDGYVLTNNHVIEGADEVRVALADGREYTATVVGADAKTDIGILKIDAADLPVATLTNSDQIRVGDIAFALGNPLGIGQTVTMGIVSATGRRQIGILGAGGYEDFIQTDAAINQGNSGGPLVDAAGRIIGINTAILSRTGGNIGIGFAIPTNLVANVMESLIATGTVERGYLGVNIQDLSPELAEEFSIPDGRGALVADVVGGSPADEAGLRRGDVVVRVGERRVQNASSLRLMISQMRPESAVSVEFIRDGEARTVEVALGRLDDAVFAQDRRETPLLEGITVSPVTPDLRRQFELPERLAGLIVTAVEPDSRYAELLPVGTVIVEINRRTIPDLATARAALRTGSRNILLVHYRGGFRYVTIVVE
jgi:serine protease Do